MNLKQLIIKARSMHTLDKNFEPLETPYSEATVLINGKEMYFKGDSNTLTAIINLFKTLVVEEIAI